MTRDGLARSDGYGPGVVDKPVVNEIDLEQFRELCSGMSDDEEHQAWLLTLMCYAAFTE